MISIAQRLQISELAGAAGTMSVAVMIGSTFMLSTTMTPLYGLYGKVFGFGELTVTLIYATYVVGNLAALLLLGRLSDTLGRRRSERRRQNNPLAWPFEAPSPCLSGRLPL